MTKNVICLWYDGAAEEAARFYAKTFPNSAVTAVHAAPGDYPDGKQGQVLTVEFTVVGVPCLGLNGGPAFKPTRTHGSNDRSRSCGGEAGVRGDDENAEDRHRDHRSGAPRDGSAVARTLM